MPQTQGEGSGMKWVVIAIALVAILAVVGWMFTRKEPSAPVPQSGNTPLTATELPQATGNVDDIISSLESAEAEEALVANAGDNDMELVTSDADAVSGMNTLYNDNEF